LLELAKKYYKTTPILYCNYFFYKFFIKNKNQTYPLWIHINESYFVEPSFQNPDCIFWQYKQDKEIINFQETIDFNVFLGDSSEFYALLKK
jgi:GH25 family lysozyme M1 (1,4-beta-N-acetylmuramidase)